MSHNCTAGDANPATLSTKLNDMHVKNAYLSTLKDCLLAKGFTWHASHPLWRQKQLQAYLADPVHPCWAEHHSSQGLV